MDNLANEKVYQVRNLNSLPNINAINTGCGVLRSGYKIQSTSEKKRSVSKGSFMFFKWSDCEPTKFWLNCNN